MKDDEMASAGVFLFSNGQMHYHLSGSRRKYQSLAPVNLLLYEASLWACHAGYKTLHLGGGVGAQEDNLYVVFKKSFNRYQDAEFHIGKKIFNPQIYQKLVDIRYKRQKEKAENTFFGI